MSPLLVTIGQTRRVRGDSLENTDAIGQEIKPERVEGISTRTMTDLSMVSFGWRAGTLSLSAVALFAEPGIVRLRTLWFAVCMVTVALNLVALRRAGSPRVRRLLSHPAAMTVDLAVTVALNAAFTASLPALSVGRVYRDAFWPYAGGVAALWMGRRSRMTAFWIFIGGCLLQLALFIENGYRLTGIPPGAYLARIGWMSLAFVLARLVYGRAQVSVRSAAYNGTRIGREHEHEYASGLLHSSTVQTIQMIGRTLRDDADQTMRRRREFGDLLLLEVRAIYDYMSGRSQPGMPLEERIARRIDAFEARSGIRPNVTLSGLNRAMPVDVCDAIANGVGEGLTNVWKHASATRVRVEVSAVKGRVEAIVADDGVGIDGRSPTAGGFGLSSLRRIVAEAGGAVVLEQEPAGGTRLVITIPFQEDE